MPMSNFVTYLSFGIGIFGILIAIIQGFERKKLKQFMYSQAWHIFSVSNLSFGAAQSALKAYKELYGDKLDPEILEYLSKCDAHNINLFIEAIRQIHLSEPKFNLETITQWTMQGKIRKEQAQYFIQIMSPELPSLIFLIWDSSVLKIKQKLIKWVKPQYPQKNTQNNSKPE